MALIKCPECGKEVSDKASACPNCGYPMIEMYKVARASVAGQDIESQQKTAIEQNNDISKERPAYNEAPEAQKRKKSPKKIVLIGIICALAIVAIVLAITWSREKLPFDKLSYGMSVESVNTVLGKPYASYDSSNGLERYKYKLMGYENDLTAIYSEDEILMSCGLSYAFRYDYVGDDEHIEKQREIASDYYEKIYNYCSKQYGNALIADENCTDTLVMTEADWKTSDNTIIHLLSSEILSDGKPILNTIGLYWYPEEFAKSMRQYESLFE